jgi:hypothetical protein
MKVWVIIDEDVVRGVYSDYNVAMRVVAAYDLSQAVIVASELDSDIPEKPEGLQLLEVCMDHRGDWLHVMPINKGWACADFGRPWWMSARWSRMNDTLVFSIWTVNAQTAVEQAAAYYRELQAHHGWPNSNDAWLGYCEWRNRDPDTRGEWVPGLT